MGNKSPSKTESRTEFLLEYAKRIAQEQKANNFLPSKTKKVASDNEHESKQGTFEGDLFFAGKESISASQLSSSDSKAAAKQHLDKVDSASVSKGNSFANNFAGYEATAKPSKSQAAIVESVLPYIKSLRVKQWLKNLIIFAPLFFGLKLFSASLFLKTFLYFIVFCFCASSVYIFNDILDKNFDENHPRKKFRPIASGQISLPAAYATSAILCLSSLLVASLIDVKFFLLCLVYIVLNAFYSIILKKIEIIDVFVIGINFCLRLLAGSFATKISVSHWLFLITFLLSLVLGFGKRRSELTDCGIYGIRFRSVISRYNAKFLEIAIVICSAIVCICYIMYSTSAETVKRFDNKYIYVTSIFVVYGILRYLQQIFVFDKDGDPTTILFEDKFLQVCVILWVLCFSFLIYF